MTQEGSIKAPLGSRRRGGKRFWPWVVHIALTVVLILVYYTFSIGLTFYQKNLFQDFKLPLTVVVIHLYLKFLLSGFCRLVYTLYTREARVFLSWHDYWTRILPPGFAAGLDIGLSQWSLEFITITLYTMSKSTALLFILIFAIIFKLEELKWSIIVLVVLIVSGLVLFTYKYTQFNLLGFMLIIAAAALSGLRWTLSQMVMQRDEIGLSNPIDMVFHIQPWMMISVLPLALIMEGSSVGQSVLLNYADVNASIDMWLRITFGGVLAFCMEISEYLLVSFTSSLTLSISGVAKEVATLSLAVYYHNEHLSIINKMGLLLCLLGISLHVLFKTQQSNSLNSRANSPSVLSSSPRSSTSNDNLTVPLLETTDIEEIDGQLSR